MTEKQNSKNIQVQIEKGNYNERIEGDYLEVKGNLNVYNYNPILQPVWDKLDSQLQDAFALAANQARREGKNIVSTRLLFAALERLASPKLSAILDRIPPESLPKPIAQEVKISQNAIDNNLDFSACVKESLATLSPKIVEEKKLSAVDIFVDIAKHGKGKSVKRLRTYGVDANKIDQIVSQFGYQIIERDL